MERLLAAGADPLEIARATGWPAGTVRQRLRLLGLHPGLRAALVAGALSHRAATAAVRLPLATQHRLVAVLEERGRLTAKDLAEVRRVRAAVTAALPFDALTATPSAEELEVACAGPDCRADERSEASRGVATRGDADPISAATVDESREWVTRGHPADATAPGVATPAAPPDLIAAALEALAFLWAQDDALARAVAGRLGDALMVARAPGDHPLGVRAEEPVPPASESLAPATPATRRGRAA